MMITSQRTATARPPDMGKPRLSINGRVARQLGANSLGLRELRVEGAEVNER